jgi:hypothetical protein
MLRETSVDPMAALWHLTHYHVGQMSINDLYLRKR